MTLPDRVTLGPVCTGPLGGVMQVPWPHSDLGPVFETEEAAKTALARSANKEDVAIEKIKIEFTNP